MIIGCRWSIWNKAMFARHALLCSIGALIAALLLAWNIANSMYSSPKAQCCSGADEPMKVIKYKFLLAELAGWKQLLPSFRISLMGQVDLEDLWVPVGRKQINIKSFWLQFIYVELWRDVEWCSLNNQGVNNLEENEKRSSHLLSRVTTVTLKTRSAGTSLLKHIHLMNDWLYV